MTKLHTPRSIGDLIRLAESPDLATILDEDVLLECAGDLYDVLQLCEDEASEGTRRHCIPVERIEAAWDGFINQGAAVLRTEEEDAAFQLADDEVMQSLLFRSAAPRRRMH